MSVTQRRNYKGLYGNLRTCLRVENKEHELNKNVLPCLLDILPVFVWRILAFSRRFQWVLGSLFSSLCILLLFSNVLAGVVVIAA